jgi:signal transduction histidine kinase
VVRRSVTRVRAIWRRLLRRLDAALVPANRLPRDVLLALDVAPAAGASNRDYRGLVLAITVPAMGFFLPSLLLAGVPGDLWVPFAVITIAVTTTVAATFLVIPRGSAAASVAPLINGVAMAVVGVVFRPYFHALDLGYSLIVSGHAVVHGIRPALLAVLVGTIVVPFAIKDPALTNPGDLLYVPLYLLGAALLPWTAWRIAQRRAAQLAGLRRHSEAQRIWLETILRSMGDAVLAVDVRGRTVVTNAAFDRLIEANGGPMTPLDDRGVRLPRARWPEARAARGESFEMHFTLAGADGERRWYEARGGPLGDQAESGGVIVIRDISDRSLRSEQEAFMATASHELRTPIAALHGYVQLLERRLDPIVNPREAEFARIAVSQTRRLGHLLERLFDLARLQSGHLDVQTGPIELVEVVNRTVLAGRALAPEREYRVDVEADTVMVEADPDRLEQVLLNLVTNAIQHAPDSSGIDIRVTVDDGHAAIAVHDDGPGIPQRQLSQLFTRRGRGASSSNGLGLGLFISRELVRAQRGSLVVASEPGAGTTVTVRLPLVGSKAGGRGRSRA